MMSDSSTSSSSSQRTSTHDRRPSTLADWSSYLRTLAQPIIGPLDVPEAFAQAQRKYLSLEVPLIIHTAKNESLQTPDVPTMLLESPHKYPDLYLWWGLIAPGNVANPLQVIDLTSDKSFVEQGLFTTIEVWTETELAALHALSLYAIAQPDNAALADRITRAIDWHLEFLQPDNATAHAWGVHSYLLRGSPEAIHFAETLVSNCQVMNAQPDELSAWTLINAANALIHVDSTQ